MRQFAADWIENRLIGNQTSSFLQVWLNSNKGWENYFTLGTTQELEEFEERVDGGYVVCKRGVARNLLEFVPEENTSKTDRARVEISSLGNESYTSTKATDVRIERSYSSSAETWTAGFPAIRYEHWVESDDVPRPDLDVQKEVHEILSEKTGIELGRYPDYRGNIVVVIEDHRATFTNEEKPHIELEPELINLEDLNITVDWEEYGSIVQTTAINTPSSVDELADSDSADDNGDSKSDILITYGDTEFNATIPDITAPGASDHRIGVRHEGELIDQRRFPLIRIITTNIQLGEETQSVSGPPAFYHGAPTDRSGHSIVVGEHIWDNRRVAFGSRSDLGGWCTDADEDVVANAFASIEADIQNAVKFVDPYLSATDITEFINLLDSDVDVWIITSNLERASALEPKLRQYKQADQSVEITRVMDQNGGPSNTPLHDRFILTSGPRGWALGTSLNTLDNNVSVISELPLRVINQLDYQFNSWWNHSIEEKNGSQICNKVRLGTSLI